MFATWAMQCLPALRKGRQWGRHPTTSLWHPCTSKRRCACQAPRWTQAFRCSLQGTLPSSMVAGQPELVQSASPLRAVVCPERQQRPTAVLHALPATEGLQHLCWPAQHAAGPTDVLHAVQVAEGSSVMAGLHDMLHAEVLAVACLPKMQHHMPCLLVCSLPCRVPKPLSHGLPAQHQPTMPDGPCLPCRTLKVRKVLRHHGGLASKPLAGPHTCPAGC